MGWRAVREVRIIARFQHIELVMKEQSNLHGDSFALHRQKVETKPPWSSRQQHESSIKGLSSGVTENGCSGLLFPGRSFQPQCIVYCLRQILFSLNDFMTHRTESAQALQPPF